MTIDTLSAAATTPAPAPTQAGRTAARSIDRLLRPRSIVIVGASDKPGALGASVLSNLDRNGFSGDIHLINPKRAAIGDRPCLASIDDLPSGADVAILAVPRAAVLESVAALTRRGVGAAIVFSSGFAEGGEAGLAEQRAIARVARDGGMLLAGPNCLGAVNYVDAIPLTFAETNITKLGDRPGIGIVSQSGAMAAVLGVVFSARALGLSYSVSTGNEAESGVEDYLEYLIADPATRVIAMIVEQFREPRRFLAAAKLARAAGKVIVLLHPGKSSAARESAATHTGAMAGDYQVMRVHVERAGVVFAETLEELGDIAEIALRCPPVPVGGTAVLAESGAFKALTLDLCEELGIDLPYIDDASAPALRAAMPDFVAVSNPTDLTAQGLVDPDMYARVLTALVDDDRFASIVVAIIQTDPVTMGIKVPPILRAFAATRPAKPVIFAGLDEGAPGLAPHIADLRALGIPYFPTTERAFRALRRLSGLAARDFATVEAAASARLDLVAGVIPEYRAKAVLAPLGIPFPAGRFVTTLADARIAAGEIGYPVVLKAQSPDLSHKSDAGGVAINLTDADALAAAWDAMHVSVAAYAPGLALEGLLIEGMGARGVELIIGAKNDPDWGPVILAGFGGVQAEILHDVRLLAPDLPIAAIIGELNQLKSAALLNGFRGAAPLDVEAVAQIIATLGRFLLANPSIREVDLNPVIVYPKGHDPKGYGPKGQGAVALDALMLVDA